MERNKTEWEENLKLYPVLSRPFPNEDIEDSGTEVD